MQSASASQITLPAQDLGFTPHKALYEINLESASSGSQLVNIKGHMYYEWAYDCEAWNSRHSFNVLYEYADNPAMRITSDFSNFERYDGSSLDYSAIREQNGVQYEEIRGHAEVPQNGEGLARYNKPEGLEQSLPEGTLFPLAHTIKTISAIKDGKRFFNATIFDGSDDEGPVEINAFIGKKVTEPRALSAAKDNDRLDEALLNGAAHNVQLAFFPQSKNEQEADYEMNLTLHHNSIISDMVIDYGDFKVSQDLIALEAIDEAIDNDAIIKACQ